MKKILLLLLFTVASYGQAVFDEGIQITNTESATATKVNVQEANGKVNTQAIKTGFNKNIGLGGSDVVGANTLLNQYSTTPLDWTATAYNSGQVVFYVGKQWISKMVTAAGDVPAVSSKWEEITFDALANKTVAVDQTIIDGSTNAVSGNAVFDGLAVKAPIVHTHTVSQITDLSKASVGLGNVDNTSDLSKPLSTATINALASKAPISSVHNPVTIGTANGLSLSTQQLSLGLASSGVTGALSGTDWNTFNNKQPAITGLTTNYLPKWNGSGFGNSSIFDNGGTDISIINSRYSEFSIKGNQSLDDGGGLIHFSNQTKKFATISGETESPNNGMLIFRNLRAGALIESLRITGNGNVGIGTTTVTDKLTVNGTISASPATTANQVVVKSQLDAVAARPYKVYTALLSQSGTNAPTATVLENTLGGTVVWSRVGVGTYVATLTGVFAVNKTICFHQRSSDLTSSSAFGYSMSSAQASTNTVDLISTLAGGLADGLIIRSSVEIRVYN